MKNSKACWLVIFSALWIFSCGEDNAVGPPAYSYRMPEQINDGWQTASLADVGMDEEIVSGAIDRINYHLYQNVHSILIVKNGKLVFEEYFSGNAFQGGFTEFDRNTIHNLASVTKSFTSALVGLAIDRGLIESVDAKVSDFFPQYAFLRDGQKAKITLEHLLTMTSGLQWDESTYPYTDTRNDIVQLFIQSDPIRYILQKPMADAPGTRWVYNGGGTNVLGEVVRIASGLSVKDFAEQYLFSPLGITDYQWQRLPNNVTYTSGDLKLRPRDMAKFGYLYLNGGVWHDEQIISKEWIQKSTEAYISVNFNWTYGYQWWLKTYPVDSRAYESFAARGWGGQYVIVFPGIEMVVVFTGGNYSTPEPAEEILVRFILPALL